MKKNILPHLNVQTNTNLSWSFLRIEEVLDFWNSNDKEEKKRSNYLAIADYYPHDFQEFFLLCKEKKLKAILGLKIFFADNEGNKMMATIYPTKGKNYRELISKTFSLNSPENRVFNFNFLTKELGKEFLIVLEINSKEEFKKIISWEIIKNQEEKGNFFIGLNFFLEKKNFQLNENILSKIIPFASIKYLKKEEEELINVWKQTSFKNKFFLEDLLTNSTHLENYEKISSYYTDDSSLFKLIEINWENFIKKINLGSNLILLEKKEEKKKGDALLKIKEKCLKKLISLEKEDEKKYEIRLEKEINIIEDLDYSEYFLQFSEIVEYLKRKKITIGPGRGSSVSSLVCYLLGITSVDPIKHELIFERFLNPKRKKMPDIDLDVENQSEVFEYLKEKFVEGKAARIQIRKKIGWKEAFLQTAKALKIKNEESKEIESLLEKNPNLENFNLQVWKSRHPNLFTLVEKIKGLYYETANHPAGVIISEKSLIGKIPLIRNKDYLITILDEQKVSNLGFKKYDFLSLKETLSFIDEIGKKSLKFLSKAGQILEIKMPSYEEINLKDEKTWKMLRNFCLTDIFQLDTTSARRLFMRFSPENFSELTIFLAINRPGILSKWKERIIKKKKENEDEEIFSSQIIKKILAETYNTLVFEEQISQIISFIYECDLQEAEAKRITWKEKGIEKNFFSMALKKLKEKEVELIFQQLKDLNNYTFNKSHAVAYTYLVYYLAFLKANFFPEWMFFFLKKKKERNLLYLREAFINGFKIEAPDVNLSKKDWSRKEEILSMGFGQLKNYRDDFFTPLLKEREENGSFSNWRDFLTRTNEIWSKVTVEELKKWINSGVFNNLNIPEEQLSKRAEELIKYASIVKKIGKNKNVYLPFFSWKDEIENKKTEKLANKNKAELESLGFYISYFQRWKNISRKINIEPLIKIYQKPEKNHMRIYAVIQELREKIDNNYEILLSEVCGSCLVKFNKLEINPEEINLLELNEELIFEVYIEKEKKTFENELKLLKIEKINKQNWLN